MDKMDITESRNILLRLREEILLGVRRKNAEAVRPPDEGMNDFGDRGADGSAKELLHLLSDAHRDEVIKLDEALERLERGVYGQCVACGHLIDKKRLSLRPHARHCVSCKEGIEARAKEIDPSRGRI